MLYSRTGRFGRRSTTCATPSGGWGTAQPISAETDDDPSVAVDAKGAAMVVWCQHDYVSGDGMYGIWSMRPSICFSAAFEHPDVLRGSR